MGLFWDLAMIASEDVEGVIDVCFSSPCSIDHGAALMLVVSCGIGEGDGDGDGGSTSDLVDLNERGF